MQRTNKREVVILECSVDNINWVPVPNSWVLTKENVQKILNDYNENANKPIQYRAFVYEPKVGGKINANKRNNKSNDRISGVNSTK